MKILKCLKTLIRSRSLDFALHSGRMGRKEVRSLKVGGVRLHYRPGSSDVQNIHKKLLMRKSEYWLPHAFRPKVILDIGGNIGVAAVDFAFRYPDARIVTVEPVRENFELLRKNTAGFPNIEAFQFALGRENVRQTIQKIGERSFGSYSLVKTARVGASEEVVVREMNAFLDEAGIGQIDLMKIDIEGAEYDLLKALDPARLEKVSWIVGELHGERDFRLLDYLAEGFDIDGRKTLTKPCWKFHAVNKRVVRELSKGFPLKNLQG
jgi:FkbM family methyltransferase